MAKANLGVVFDDLRRRLGNVVLTKWKGTNVVKPYKWHSTGHSPDQLAVRANFSAVISVWRKLAKPIRRTWDDAAKTLNMTGYNLFVGTNTKHLDASEPMTMARGGVDSTPLSIAAVPGALGEIAAAFTLPAELNGMRVLFLAQKIMGTAMNTMTVIDAGVNAASPYTITGLEPGAAYAVHVFCADDELSKAEAVSGSLGAFSSAGA